MKGIAIRERTSVDQVVFNASICHVTLKFGPVEQVSVSYSIDADSSKQIVSNSLKFFLLFLHYFTARCCLLDEIVTSS